MINAQCRLGRTLTVLASEDSNRSTPSGGDHDNDFLQHVITLRLNVVQSITLQWESRSVALRVVPLVFSCS